MNVTSFLGLRLTAASETAMTFLEWRTLMNGVNNDSNIEMIDGAIQKLNEQTGGKADGFLFNQETGVLQLTSNGEPLPRGSVLIDLGGFYTKEEVDAMVQEATRTASVGAVEWDKTNRQLQLYNAAGEPIGEPVTIDIDLTEYSYTITLTDLMESRAVTVASGGEVQVSFNYASVNADGDDDGNGVGIITVNNIRMAAVAIAQGDNVVDVSSYLGVGDNTVKIKVENSEGATKMIQYQVKVVALSMATTFNGLDTYSGDVLFKYTPTGIGEKTIHFIVDGVEIGTESVSASGRSLSYIVPAQEHGGHVLKVYATMTVNGVAIKSNTLVLGMLWIDSSSTLPAITSTFVTSEATEGEGLTIPYMVHDPKSENADIVLSIITENGSVYWSKPLTVDRSEQKWAVQNYPAGNITFRISSGEVNFDMPVAVSESTLVINPVTDGLTLEFSAENRNNNEENPGTWSYGDVEAIFSGFGWNAADGWHDDENGTTCLRFLPGDLMEIPFTPFAADLKGTGATIEVDMATRDVRDYDSIVFSCASFTADGRWRGFQIASQYAAMRSEQSSVSMQFKEDSRVRISIVIEQRNLLRLIYIYINGVMCGVTQYPTSDDFQQKTPVGLTIGSESCGIDLYRIRYYSKGLNRAEILDNFIYDQPTLSERQSAYRRNNIIENDEIVIAKLPPNLPYMIISSAELPQAKGDVKFCQIIYTDPADSSRSFSADNVEIDVQGTSSQAYKKKNFKLKFKKGVVYTDGDEVADAYQLRANSIPATVFTMKADVASSENANNVQLVDYYNTLIRKAQYLTPPQEEDARIRQGIDGVPCVIFWYNTNDNTTRFWGIYICSSKTISDIRRNPWGRQRLGRKNRYLSPTTTERNGLRYAQ